MLHASKVLKEIIYLPGLNRRACGLVLLLFVFVVGLSGCKQPKTEAASKPKAEEARAKVKAGEAEIIAIANKYAAEKWEDLKAYKNPAFNGKKRKKASIDTSQF